MISTYTTEYQNNLIQEYLSYNLVALLIFKPTLGITDSPTNTELLARKTLTMAQAAAAEIALTNGYTRVPVSLVLDTTNVDASKLVYKATVIMTPNITGPFASATHICFARGVSLAGATLSNGNNRGDTAGTLVKVEPLVGSPLSIAAGVTFTYNSQFIVSAQAV